MFGLYNINKPSGITSRDVVNRVQRLVRPAKAGHAGTLDPLASGVLVVCVGPATRLIPYVQRMTKHYRATFLLGHASDTDDVYGEVCLSNDPYRPSREEILETLKRFLGEILQRPPRYSAVKVKGQRAYRLARRQEPIELPARPVTIHELHLRDYTYPTLELDVVCGSGTYIRSLGRDVAAELGTTAIMSSLVRTAIGTFSIEESVRLEDISADSADRYLLPAIRAVEGLPRLMLTEQEVERVARGLTIVREGLAATDPIAAMDTTGQLGAILVRRGDGRFGPVRNFVVEATPRPVGPEKPDNR
jgi:tRNA pseudouridine55 synthase